MTEKRLEISSFEKMDELMKVTDPKGWLGFMGVVVLIFLGVIWLFYGKIPTKVNGTGMLINVGGIETISANVNGRVVKFETKVGDRLAKDQPIAYISQPALEAEIRNIKQKIQEQIIANNEKEKLRVNLESKYDQVLSALNKKLESQEKLLKSGLVLEKDALDTKEKITETEKLYELFKIEKLNDESVLSALKRELDVLNEKYERESIVRSPYNGVVFELEAAEGDVITNGMPLLIVEESNQTHNDLQGIIYISAIESKRVNPGMKVSIIPSTIKPEEYGTMIGTVASISSYPATFKGIMRNLHNEEMVKKILAVDSQVEVIIDLVPDKNTFSKYKWSSRNGPPVKISSGTLCNAKITVVEKKPIELLIPKIVKIFRVED